MTGSHTRLAAIETLSQLEKTRKPVSLLFDTIAGRYRISGSDRQLAMKIVYGVLRNRDYLDRLLKILCNRPLNRIKPFVHHALHSGLYQIFFLDRIPPSAAINETVNALKTRKFPTQLQGFVNGVLRQSLRRRDELPSPDEPDANNRPPLNHPAWLTKRWLRRYGEEEMVRICQHNNGEAQLCLRAHSANAKQTVSDALAAQGLVYENGLYAPDALLLRDYSGPVVDLPGIREGIVHVQDQAAQLAAMLLAPFPADLACLDGCAGLGGKTLHLIELLEGGNAHLTAVEPDRHRYRILSESLASPPASIDIELANDTFQHFCSCTTRRFDRILIDAPCSGTGVIGRHPDIRWNRREKDLAGYAGRQLELLSAAAGVTSPGGVLVYATCSIEAEENEVVIERFLDRHDEFHTSDCSTILPASCSGLIRDGFFAPLPAYGIDGFFAARLVKRGKDDER